MTVEEGIKLVASGNGDFVGGDNRCLAHAAWQIFLAPNRLRGSSMPSSSVMASRRAW